MDVIRVSTKTKDLVRKVMALAVFQNKPFKSESDALDYLLSERYIEFDELAVPAINLKKEAKDGIIANKSSLATDEEEALV